MKKIWIDTDLVVVDIFAIAMLLEAEDKVEIAGLSTISSHERIHKITQDTKAIFSSAGKEHIQIYRGMEYPLEWDFEQAIQSRGFLKWGY